jgi:NTE family protein
MNFQLRPNLVKASHRLPFECVTLLLQGGGALGAYQGGVYEALAEADIHPNWIAGISIGRLMPPLSQATRPIPASTDCASSGRR